MCDMTGNKIVEDEDHFIVQCDPHCDIRHHTLNINATIRDEHSARYKNVPGVMDTNDETNHI